MRSGLPDSSTVASSSPLGVPVTEHPWIWRAVSAADRFVRLHFLGFTFFLVLLGVTSVAPNPSIQQILLVMAVGILFHNFAYVFNDVVDLPVDRTQPSRRRDFLVRGVIRPWQALAFSLLQIPLALGLSWWAGVGIEGAVVLVVGFVLMAIYDLWGKKCFCPPLTDLAQGLAWGCLVLFGAFACGSNPNLLTWVAFVSGAGFICLINGVHGGLRDIANDLERGSLTTAIFFGSRPEAGTIPVHQPLRVFAMSVQALLVVTIAIPLVFNSFHFSTLGWMTMAAFQTLIQCVTIHYMLRVFRTDSPSWGRDFRVHIFLLLLGPAILFGFHMQGVVGWLFPVAFFGPFLLVEVTVEVASRVIDSLRRAGRRRGSLAAVD